MQDNEAGQEHPFMSPHFSGQQSTSSKDLLLLAEEELHPTAKLPGEELPRGMQDLTSLREHPGSAAEHWLTTSCFSEHHHLLFCHPLLLHQPYCRDWKLMLQDHLILPHPSQAGTISTIFRYDSNYPPAVYCRLGSTMLRFKPLPATARGLAKKRQLSPHLIKLVFFWGLLLPTKCPHTMHGKRRGRRETRL